MRGQSLVKGLLHSRCRCNICPKYAGKYGRYEQQRRRFGSRPDSAESLDSCSSSDKPRPATAAFGRGWGNPSFGGSVTFTAAEAKQRELLLANQAQIQQKQAPSAPPSSVAHGSGIHSNNTTKIQQPKWLCPNCGKSNKSLSVQCVSCHYKPPLKRIPSRKSAGITIPDNGSQSKSTQTSKKPKNQGPVNVATDESSQPTKKSATAQESVGNTVVPSSQQASSVDSDISTTHVEPASSAESHRSHNFLTPNSSKALDSNFRGSTAQAHGSWEMPGFRKFPQQSETKLAAALQPSSSNSNRDIHAQFPPNVRRDTSNPVRRSPGEIGGSVNYADERGNRSSKTRKRKGGQTAHLEDLDEEPHYKPSRRKESDHAEEEDELDDEFDPDRRKRKIANKDKKWQTQKQSAPTPIVLPDFISVGSLADILGIRRSIFLKRLITLGFDDMTDDHVLDSETAGLIAVEYNFEPVAEANDIDLIATPIPEDTSQLPPRPPVVTIMGHVDHGKTTLLDYLRKSSVVETEHGGITQHIGAFSVSMPSGKQITFLDTPGHAAFLEMRKRGADVTDIVILVVAGDDSVKPQTIEAIKHAKGANVPIIVAINKIDKEDANMDRVKQDLARHSVNVEDYGGDVQAIGVSGKTGLGMLELEEAVITLSEMLDLRAERECNFEGWIIEASTKKGGRAATVLVRQGTLRPGDVIVAGTSWAKVRTLRNESGLQISKALPGTPVEVDGWKHPPVAGFEALQAPDEQRAKQVVELRLAKEDMQRLGGDVEAINQNRRQDRERRHLQGAQEKYGGTEENTEPLEKSGPEGIPFIVKADVSGSAEAIVNSISAVGNNEVFAKILRFGIGKVGESDIQLASATNAGIISFNQQVDTDIMKSAIAHGVNVMNHNIIYELIDDVKLRLSENLAPNIIQRVSGEAEIGEIFEIRLKGRRTTSVAGCKVRNGVIHRSHKVRVLRNKKVIHDGTLSSLKNVKKDVTEMRKGTECGLAFDDWTDFAVGDEVQTYEVIHEKRHLN